ncbi:SPW repeat domain-containing protein [Streptoalloteichus hindustanus]|uniref:SPW repeat-containing protein n=1 Tax=Streptoalloteichus hindustanus TaxID=2017 RepID=A0A1M5GHA3_STRHI|nr:SPW repeat protein [Streptoalloteichus hindustanus]SHG03066.1 SPW repeat-containing protein [Streptoalloteichus hindustanus]
MTRPWSRWQDWASVVLGVYTLLAPLWTDTNTSAMWTMIVFGALLAVTGLWSLATPGSVVSEYSHVVLGALLFLAPWVMRYSDYTQAAWTSWIVGVLAVVVGLAAVPAASAAHRGHVAGQH